MFSHTPIRRLLTLSMVCLATGACAGDNRNEDDDSSGDDTNEPQDGANELCSATLTLGFPDGSSTTVDYCQRHSLSATYEFDPDAPPEVRSPTIELSAVQDPLFECRLQIQVPEACGEGYYRLDGESAGVRVVTFDCSDVADEFEGDFESAGYIRFDTVSAGETAGNLSGQPVSTHLAGYLSVETETGITLTGDFDISSRIVANDSEDRACASSDGDEDDDGFIDLALDGDDCDDTSALTHPGAAENEPGLCAKDADNDGYGDKGATAPVEAGADCNDDRASDYPGAVAEASSTECMRDDDHDGWGDADVSGTNYDRGTDCDDDDSSLNNDDADTDSYTTCEGDCNDGSIDQNPGELEVCENSRDDNCDDRVDEYCDFDDAVGTIHFSDPSNYSLCSYRLRNTYSASSGDCADCDFHFIERDTQLYSGSSTYCRTGFTTYVGINVDTLTMYLYTNLGTTPVDLIADLDTWTLQDQQVTAGIRHDFYLSESWSDTHSVSASFSLYGSW